MESKGAGLFFFFVLKFATLLERCVCVCVRSHERGVKKRGGWGEGWVRYRGVFFCLRMIGRCV